MHNKITHVLSSTNNLYILDAQNIFTMKAVLIAAIIYL